MSERAVLSYPRELVTSQDLSLDPLTAISPIDGRYAHLTAPFRPFFSEYGLMRGQVMVNVAHLIALSREGVIRPLGGNEIDALNNMWINFDLQQAKRIKEIEGKVKHNVKSMEYGFKERLEGSSLMDVIEMVRLGFTSEDDTNLARNIYLAISRDTFLVPQILRLAALTDDRAQEWLGRPMVGRTHLRRAVPTTVAKEVEEFALRFAERARELREIPITGKMTGAVGNLNELRYACPNVDWIGYSKRFVSSLGLEPDLYTTQSQNYDRLAKILQVVHLLNTNIRSLDDNMRGYISHDYFVLPPQSEQIGSSVMPHKGRNPELYDRSAGSAAIANGLLEVFIRELPNRLFQRQFDDSTMVRYIGEALSVSYLSWEFAINDLTDTILSEHELRADLVGRWEMITSGLQTRMRVVGIDKPYERFDELAKSGTISRERLTSFIEELPVSDEEKAYLLGLTPESYTGYADKLAMMMHSEIETLRHASQ